LYQKIEKAFFLPFFMKLKFVSIFLSALFASIAFAQKPEKYSITNHIRLEN